MNPIAKTVLRLFIITVVLTVCTFIYSIFESQPSKIISYFIVTFILSILLGVITLLIGRFSKAPEQSFIRDPFKVILAFILVIGVSKILGAYTADTQLTNEVSTTSDLQNKLAIENYINEDYGVSFTYPSNWTPRTPQRQSTLILLYEDMGTKATCNLSMVVQDKETIENYDAEYFKNNLSKIHSSIDNLETRFTNINGKTVSLTTYATDVQTNEGPLNTRFTTLTSLHKNQRFMLIITVPSSNNDQIQNDVRTITESLKFN